MDMLTYFRKAADTGWVCKCATTLQVDRGRLVRFRPGQSIITGDYHLHGMDMVIALDLLAGPQGGTADERPQNMAQALAA